MPQLETELARRRRVADMMLTAHSVLRDRYAVRAAALDVAVLALSVLLCLTTFLDPAVLRVVHVSDSTAHITLGISSAAVFFLALVQLRVDWKACAVEHQRACEKLARLKGDYRRIATGFATGAPTGPSDTARVLEAADRILEELRPIPDSEFASLKARHNRKVEVSRILDRYPGAPVLLLRTMLWWRHTVRVLKDGSADKKTET